MLSAGSRPACRAAAIARDRRRSASPGRRLEPARGHHQAAVVQMAQDVAESLHGQAVVLGQAVGPRGHRAIGRGQGELDHVEAVPAAPHEAARVVHDQAQADIGVERGALSYRLHGQRVGLDRRDLAGPAGDGHARVQPAARLQDQRPRLRPQPVGQRPRHVVRKFPGSGPGQGERAEVVAVESHAVLAGQRAEVGVAQPREHPDARAADQVHPRGGIPARPGPLRAGVPQRLGQGLVGRQLDGQPRGTRDQPAREQEHRDEGYRRYGPIAPPAGLVTGVG